MSQSQVQSMPQETFLLVAVNLLHKAFIEATRIEAKALYKRIADDEIVTLTRVKLADDFTATFQLSLSYSEFQGRLNFGAFRASVAALVANISRALQEKRELKVFNALNEGSAIFGVTAVTLEDDKHNVMVLATNSSEGEAATVLQLMYLDPSQFAAGGDSPTDATA